MNYLVPYWAMCVYNGKYSSMYNVDKYVNEPFKGDRREVGFVIKFKCYHMIFIIRSCYPSVE